MTPETTEDAHSSEHAHHLIQFKVDGEPYTTHAKEITANDLMKDFAGRDPATHYLVQIKGHEKDSYEGRRDVPIRMHEGQRFQVIATGPTPVSDCAHD